MTTTFLRALFALLVITSSALPADIGELSRRYARDEKMLGSALRYERTKNGVREQLWVTEMNDIVKASRETAETKEEVFLRYDIHGESESVDVYLAIQTIIKTLSDGSRSLREERTFFAPHEMLHKAFRNATFPLGKELVISPKTPFKKIELSTLSGDERLPVPFYRFAGEIIRNVRAPAYLVQNPAKDAPADWDRVKVIQNSASPNGRYAIALAPDKLKFDWNEYIGPDILDGYWVPNERSCNYVVDMKSHTILGKIRGEHPGTRPRYSGMSLHLMSWSPDGNTFIQTQRLGYGDICSMGHIDGGKLTANQDLSSVLTATARKCIEGIRSRGNQKLDVPDNISLYFEDVKDDGKATASAQFWDEKTQGPSVNIRFRLNSANTKPGIKILDVSYSRD